MGSEQTKGRRRNDLKDRRFNGHSREKAKTTKKLVMKLECIECKWKNRKENQSIVGAGLLPSPYSGYWSSPGRFNWPTRSFEKTEGLTVGRPIKIPRASTCSMGLQDSV